MVSTNKRLLDSTIRHAVEIDRLQEHEARAAVTFLNQHVLPDIRARLETGLATIASGKNRARGLGHLKSLQKLEADLDELSSIGYAALHDKMSDRLSAIAMAEGHITANQIDRAIPRGVGAQIGNASAATLNNIIKHQPFEGKILKDWFIDLDRSTRSNIKSQLNIGLANGETTPQLVKRIMSSSGVFGKARHNADAVVRTAVAHVSSQTREEVYKANNDIIEKVQWLSTLDARTTPICQARDGQAYAVGKGPRPPAHFRCRSTTVPIVGSYKKFGLKDPSPSTRASLNGQVPGKVTYSKWLKGQGTKVQNDALGVKRAQMFRKGQVDIKSLVNNRGRPLTLKEIAKRNGLSTSTQSKLDARANPLTDEQRKRVRSLDSTISRLKKKLKTADVKDHDAILAKIKKAEDERNVIKKGDIAKPKPIPPVTPPPKPVLPPVPKPKPPAPKPTPPPPPALDPEARKRRIASLASTKSRTKKQLDQADAQLRMDPANEKLLKKRAKLQQKLDEVTKEYNDLRSGKSTVVDPTAPKPVAPKPVAPPPQKAMTGAQMREEYERRASGVDLDEVQQRRIAMLQEDIDYWRSSQENGARGTGWGTSNMHIKSLQKQIDDIRLGDGKGRQLAHDIILDKQNNLPNLKVSGGGRKGSASRAKVDEATDFIGRLLSPTEKATVARLDIKCSVSARTRRAYAYADQAEAFLGTQSPTRTYVHEFAHIIESRVGHTGGMHQWNHQVRKFFKRRTQGEEARLLSNLTGHLGYGPEEIAKKDKFMEVYMGKIYKHANSEITSMAFELLYADPVTLMTTDPDMFDFIIDLAKGHIKL